MSLRITAAIALGSSIVLSGAATPAKAGILFRDKFTGTLSQWTVTNNADGSSSIVDGRLHVDASDSSDQGSGTFGLVQTSSFNRLASGQGNIYVYYWGVQLNDHSPQNFYLGPTTNLNTDQPNTDSELVRSAYYRHSTSPDPDIQEQYLQSSLVGAQAPLHSSAGGPLLQPAANTDKYDFRIVVADQGNTGNDQFKLEYKLSSSAAWLDFFSDADNGGTLYGFPTATDNLRVAFMPRERVNEGSDFFVQEVLVSTNDQAFIPEPATLVLLALGSLALVRRQR